LRPRAIHQFVPSLASRDAIGNHTLAVQELLWDMGFESRIYARETTPDLAGRALPYEAYVHGRRRRRARRAGLPWIIYQCSIDSPMVELLVRWEEPKVVNYHNITPGHLLEPWTPRVAHEVGIGRRQLEALAPVAAGAISDSAFNAAELERLGFCTSLVCPPLFDLSRFAGQPDPKASARLAEAKADGGADWLFVGRITPHKAQHDLVKALAAYRRVYDPKARLHLVGGSLFAEYEKALRRLVGELGLDGEVDMPGSVSHPELVSYYRSADVLVCASDHEGFCVPLLEAMYHRLPIVAYGAGAVPETLGGAGLVLADKSPACLAAGVHRVLSDPGLAASLVREGERRLGEFSLERSRARFARALEQILGAGVGR